MKRIGLYILGLVAGGILLTACSQQSENKLDKKVEKAIPQKESVLEMNKDTLDAKIIDDITKQTNKQKYELTAEAISSLGKTRDLLDEIENGSTENAIEKGQKLIGELEVLLSADPSLVMIPVDIDFQKNELITDIETVREITKEAEEAMDNGYYQLAAKMLEGLKSELVINTYYIPAASYPLAIKDAVVLLKEDKKLEATQLLSSVLQTVVIEKAIEPLPVLNAEQMIIEAASIDKKDHENADKVLNLLKNADYQLSLAEEMGYGKKDTDFKMLSESIDKLKISVEKKEDSLSKFDSLKSDLIRFKEELFASGKKE